MTFDNTQRELLLYFTNKPALKHLIYISDFLLIVLGIASVLENFMHFGIISIFLGLFKFLVILLVLAKAHYRILSIGFILFFIGEFIYTIQSIPTIRYSGLVWGITYLLFGILSFKKSESVENEIAKIIDSSNIQQSKEKENKIDNFKEFINDTYKNKKQRNYTLMKTGEFIKKI